MKNLISKLGLGVGVLALICSPMATAATVTTLISGRMGVTQETCLQAVTINVVDGENCMYDGGPSADAGLVPTGEVTGPYSQIAYYDSVATQAAFTATTDPVAPFARTLYAPTEGDGKIQQVISGSVSIDDNGNGFGSDDLISFTVTLTSPGSGAIVKIYGASVIDKYDSMTQVLMPVAASSVIANGSGGFDYIIGSEGFPDLLTFKQAGNCLGVAFGSVECPHSFNIGVDPDYWNGTSLAGLGSLENNLGVKTTGTVVNLACIDSAPGLESNDCLDSEVSYNPWVNGPCDAVGGGCTLKEGAVGAVRGSAEDVGWDQLLLKVSTNASGNVIAVSGFNVEDFRLDNQTRCGDNDDPGATGTYNAVCNSWTSGYFTAGAGDAMAVDDTASTTPSVAISIPIGANDTGFGLSVTATAGSCDSGGNLAIVGSAGPTSGISADYTPDPAFGSPGGEIEVCSYTLDDGLHPVDSADVTITVTAPADTTPNPFTFVDQTGVALSTTTTSAPITITGINVAAAVSVSGGEVSVGCTGTFSAAPTTLLNGQTVCVRHVSAATNSASINTTLTIGGVADTFTSTTVAAGGGGGGGGALDGFSLFALGVMGWMRRKVTR